MKTAHIRTAGMQCEHCPVLIARALRKIPGVADAVAYRTLRLTSVLYDPEVTAVDALSDCVACLGFRASIVARAGDHEVSLERGTPGARGSDCLRVTR